jgi:thioredoxin reductase (NADPH)
MEEVLDLAVVGAGPSGLATSIESTRRGLSHLVFDEGSLVDAIRRFPVNLVEIVEHVASRMLERSGS